MHREIHQWHSPSLDKSMEIAVYGHYGYALLLFPTAGADYLEYERFQLIEAIAPYINSGTVKAFSVNSINNESWLNNAMQPQHKGIRHQQYNDYIITEVVPFIHRHHNGESPILTAGASLGAFHALNLFFRRPDIFAGTIAMSGDYNLQSYTKGYFDDNVFFNSPEHYLPGVTDHEYLEQMRRGKIVIASGQGNFENPDASRRLSGILHSKSIPHWLDLWGHDMPHDWPTWRAMLPYFLGKL